MQKFGLRRCIQLCLSLQLPLHDPSALLTSEMPAVLRAGKACARPMRGAHCWLRSKEIDVSRLESCSPCAGSGIKSGTSASTCGTCGGSGQVVQAVRTPLGVFQQARSLSHVCPYIFTLRLATSGPVRQRTRIGRVDRTRPCPR